MLNVDMLNVIMLSVIMLNAVAPKKPFHKSDISRNLFVIQSSQCTFGVYPHKLCHRHPSLTFVISVVAQQPKWYLPNSQQPVINSNVKVGFKPTAGRHGTLLNDIQQNNE